MSTRGIIGIETPYGQVSRVLLHSDAYPASIRGNIAAGEILLKHYSEPEKIKALIHDSIAQLGPTPEQTRFHQENGTGFEDAPLEQCIREAETDIYIEFVYIFGEGGWIYWKTRDEQELPEPLDRVIRRETKKVWRALKEYSGKAGIQEKLL